MSLSQAVFSLDVLSIFKTMHQKPQRSNETIIPCNLLPHDQVRSNSHKGNEVAKPVTPQSESVLSCTNIPTTTFELLQNPGHKTEGNKPWLTRQSVRAVWESKEDVVAGARKRRQRDAESSKRVKTTVSHGEDVDELEAHYSYMAKIQEVSPEESSSSGQSLEHVQNHDENDVFANVDQNAAECVDERDALANLIANLTLDIEENKTILKQLKKANAIIIKKHCQLKEKTKVISDLKVKEGKDIDTMIEMEKQIKFLNEILYKRNQSIQTIHMLAPKCATYNGRSTFASKVLKRAH
ncbi:hypothetical protein Tco_1131944 [Tanacetum coccineum]|uniref:Gag-pol polyprotein n=1 Tax=Tanacetum coccineum TaxID=301880 RepID=A0ABQ5JAK8_9ASTR